VCASGHHDGLVASLAVQAIGAIAEMKALVGDHTGAAAAQQQHATSVQAFSRIYWNGQVFSDWVDSAGRARNYFYTWHNLIAVTSGIANDSQAASIMGSLAAERSRLEQQFNLSTGGAFCTPANMRPADPDDILYCNANQPFPFYENGKSLRP
jgi:hypothetical protein